MEEERTTFFSHKQKSLLIGLLACTAVFSLVLVFGTVGMSGRFARTTNVRPSTAKAEPYCDGLANMYTTAVNSGDDETAGAATHEWNAENCDCQVGLLYGGGEEASHYNYDKCGSPFAD
jgi:hypothetical protein